MGVLLQLKGIFNCAYANIMRFSLERWNNFNVISACYNRISQFCMGKSRSVEQRPTMKWSLNVLIAHSAALQK